MLHSINKKIMFTIILGLSVFLFPHTASAKIINSPSLVGKNFFVMPKDELVIIDVELLPDNSVRWSITNGRATIITSPLEGGKPSLNSVSLNLLGGAKQPAIYKTSLVEATATMPAGIVLAGESIGSALDSIGDTKITATSLVDSSGLATANSVVAQLNKDKQTIAMYPDASSLTTKVVSNQGNIKAYTFPDKLTFQRSTNSINIVLDPKEDATITPTTKGSSTRVAVDTEANIEIYAGGDLGTGEPDPGGIVVKVGEGAVVISNPGDTTEVGPGQSIYVERTKITGNVEVITNPDIQNLQPVIGKSLVVNLDPGSYIKLTSTKNGGTVINLSPKTPVSTWTQILTGLSEPLLAQANVPPGSAMDMFSDSQEKSITVSNITGKNTIFIYLIGRKEVYSVPQSDTVKIKIGSLIFTVLEDNPSSPLPIFISGASIVGNRMILEPNASVVTMPTNCPIVVDANAINIPADANCTATVYSGQISLDATGTVITVFGTRTTDLNSGQFFDLGSLDEQALADAGQTAISLDIVQTAPPSNAFGLGSISGTGLGENKSLQDIVAGIINIVLGLLGVVDLIIILYGGFKWMTAAGSEENTAEAKKIIIVGVIGIAIILGAYAIAQFVFSSLISATGA